MKLSDLHAHTVSATVQILDEAVAIKVRPAKYTPELESRIVAAADARDISACLAEILAHIDITEPDADGVERPIVCDADTLHRVLPVMIMQQLWTAIGEMLRPGEAKGETSASG